MRIKTLGLATEITDGPMSGLRVAMQYEDCIKNGLAPKEGGGWTVTGNTCPRGAKYAVQEMEAPERVVTSTVRVEGGASPLVAAKTASPVPKGSVPACLDAIRALAVPAPVSVGQVLAPDLAGTGVALIATAEVA